ncbi:protein FLX-like 4 isoform X2 [Tripterygium wilfordii]|uniref:protein FLX-like 4 isoform X2 n=1 Tax=Tripterygium wilfordii TaxID=458696 RepID=UPI0018F7EECE|nr:protein FLX-like 4 isoform X2 [Tripterygium wilfordii]
MSARGRVPPSFERRSIQAPVMMRHRPFLGDHRSLEPLPPPEVLENKIASQAAEMERLARDNHRLAAIQVAMREDLTAAHQELQRLKAHARSIQTESDIQIRFLLDKIAKMEADIRSGENIKKDLQKAHSEAQSLVNARGELTARIQQVSQELQKARVDINILPEMHAELDSLTQEHERLRETFESEKGSNMEQVEQLKGMEKNLIGMVQEVEKLRAEVLNAENRALGNPFGGGYMNHNHPYPPYARGSGAYFEGYRRPGVSMASGPGGEAMIPYGNSYGPAATGGIGNAPVSGAGDAIWGGPYKP